jgi:hypothetical protein
MSSVKLARRSGSSLVEARLGMPALKDSTIEIACCRLSSFPVSFSLPPVPESQPQSPWIVNHCVGLSQEILDISVVIPSHQTSGVDECELGQENPDH